MLERRYSRLDRVLSQLDTALRATSAPPPAHVPPAPPAAPLNAAQRRKVGQLLRVDRAGEIAAQALYQGQALTARRPAIRKAMAQAAAEEIAHLSWTTQRLRELGTHNSYLDPLWYAGSFAIGALAGAAGDRWSLGFVAETERQVSAHLQDHLNCLPPEDGRSRAILEKMLEDERRHATDAVRAGGRELPRPARVIMRGTARIMTTLAKWI